MANLDTGLPRRSSGHRAPTEAYDGDYDLSDLEAAMEAFARRDIDPNSAVLRPVQIPGRPRAPEVAVLRGCAIPGAPIPG